MKINRLWLGGALTLFLAFAYHLPLLGSIPPGLDRDAAANGLLALDWLHEGLVPFWMPHASAPEPLIVWLQSVTTLVLGPSVVALRSASVIFLALAAPVAYLLAWEVAKSFAPAQRWWAALFAGLIFACNPVITQLARTGLRATTLPLLSGLFFLLLLRAWHSTGTRGHILRAYLLSGVVLGLAAYTYLAARFLPIVVIVFVALAWGIEARQGRAAHQQHDNVRLLGLLIMVLAAFVIVLPQLIFFARYPAAFWERAQSVSLLTNPEYSENGLMRLLLDRTVALLQMFGVEWSGQYNQAARPLLLPVPFVGLLLSLPLVVRWRRQPALLLMVVAGLLFLLPDLIGGDRVRPHELRVIGAFVPVMVLSGVGLAYALGWMMKVLKGAAAHEAVGALLALLIVGWAFVDWFGGAVPVLAQSEYEWFARPDVALAESINRSDAPVLLPLNDYSRSVVAYLSAKRITELRSGIDANGKTVSPSVPGVHLLWPAEPERVRVESISYRFDPQSLVLIDGGRAYLMPPAQADVAQLQRECAAQPITTATGEAAGALCEVDFAAFVFPEQLPQTLWPVDDRYADGLRLHGVGATSDVLSSGAELGITSYWQAEQRSGKRWRYFVHVLDDQQGVIAGDDLIPGYGVYGTQHWQVDEIVPVRQVVQLPSTLEPGRYWIEVGLYDPLNLERASVQGSGETRTLVGPLKVPLQGVTELPEATPLRAHFGDEIALDGYKVERENGLLRVTLRLSALRRPDHDYTLFLHVENAAGEIVAQRDAQPLDGRYPTAIWDAGEVVVADWDVVLPSDFEAGEYRLWMGFYEWQSGARLPVQDTSAAVDADRLLLGEFRWLSLQ